MDLGFFFFFLEALLAVVKHGRDSCGWDFPQSGSVDVERRLDTAKCVLQVATERKEEKQEEGRDVKGSGRERERER